MKTVKISLNSIDKVKAFVNEVTKYDEECKIHHGYFQFGFVKTNRPQYSQREQH